MKKIILAFACLAIFVACEIETDDVEGNPKKEAAEAEAAANAD